ncbi:hypothetical protein PV04_07262 [Phialophora macrospora]|uniref:Zn(2)-C6 fungal-type domain-containing protein n=1 Tax=Phialophora macrospora TaxID=1851006 RepID=A0A0D2FAE4_9EURO|nr:hypothetical protein PV04_07262 [Phialophora macrospora]
MLRQKRFTNRSRSGCTTCRRRRKKCPGGAPECETCLRLNLQCVWENKRRVTEKDKAQHAGIEEDNFPRHALSSEDTISTGLWQLCSQPPYFDPLDSDRAMLVSYFVHSFVPSNSVIPTTANFYLTVYLPMSFVCPSVAEAIQACAAIHLAKTCLDPDRQKQLVDISKRHQARCHVFLKERITLSGRLQRDVLEACSIILLLVDFEIIHGSDLSLWISQLDCVRKIIHQAGGRTKFCGKSYSASSIYLHFLYYDVRSLIMERVTGKASPRHEVTQDYPVRARGPQDSWMNYLAPGLRSGEKAPKGGSPNGTASIHPYLGIYTDLFLAFQRLRSVKVVYDSDGIIDLQGSRSFFELEHHLLTMRFDEYLREDTGTSSDAPETRLSLVSLAEAYRFSALVLLYRRVRGYEDHVTALASQIISLTKRIPSGSAVENGLPHPLFLAGTEISSDEEIAVCSTKLANIRERVKVMNILLVEQALKQRWRERLN